MTDNDRTLGRRRRLMLGLGVVGASLLAATVVAGVGFAGGSISASQYQYNKVTICHHTHSKKHRYVTITVSKAAWPAHQRRGDTLGPCASTSHTTPGHHGSHEGHGSGNGSSDPDASSSTSNPQAPHGHGNGSGGDSGHGNGSGGGSGHGHK